MRKYIGKVGMAVMMIVAFAACSQTTKEKEEELDPRDAFVGTYTYEATGKTTIYNIPVIDTLSIPLNNEGEAVIAKEGDRNKVIIVSNNDTIRAEVTGNQLRLDSNSVAYTYGKFRLRMMLSNDKATLEGKHIEWEADIMAVGTYEALSLTGDGHLKIVADKKD